MSPKRTRAKAAIVREVKRVDEPISVEAYDSEWPAQYATEAARLRKGLDGSVLAIEHIGSTAVVGLAAKPIIDVMVGVDELNTTDDLASQLAVLGYEDCGGAEGRRYFRRRGAGQHSNVHLIEYERSRWRENIRFRDYLRSNEAAAQRYSEPKQAAAIAAPTLLAYSTLKAAIIDELLGRASLRS
jgi:GrpB-like predicted nucleotidyltransferase (UPF0157 family)